MSKYLENNKNNKTFNILRMNREQMPLYLAFHTFTPGVGNICLLTPAMYEFKSTLSHITLTWLAYRFENNQKAIYHTSAIKTSEKLSFYP